MNTNQQTKNLILSALFAALTCVSSVILHFHFPGSPHGCISICDCFVLMAGIMLGPVYGTASAGLGAMLGDIFMGHFEYAAATLILKASAALAAALVYRATSKKQYDFKMLHTVSAGLAGETVSVIGFFIYDGLLFGGLAASVATLPANLIQAVIGITLSVILLKILNKLKLTDKMQ